MIELSRHTEASFVPAESVAGCGESPLIDVAYQAISRLETQFSPIVLLGSEELGLSRWVQAARETAATHPLANKPAAEPSIVVFRGREFAQSVGHAHTTDSIDEFRQKLDGHQVIVIEYPSDVAENSVVYRELIELLDRSERLRQLVVVVLEQSLTKRSRGPNSLSSRLSAGLQLQINEPPRRLKIAFLQEHLQPWLEEVNPELIDQLLSLPVPVWSGWQQCVTRLQNELQQHGKWPDHPADLLKDSAQSTPDAKLIGQQVARHAQVKWSDIKGHSRRQSLVRARSIAIYLIRELTGNSFESIGRLFGNRDHSTIIHAYRKILCLRTQDADLEACLQHVCQALRVAVPAGTEPPSG